MHFFACNITWNSSVSNLATSVFEGSFMVPRETPSSSSTGEMLSADDAFETAARLCFLENSGGLRNWTMVVDVMNVGGLGLTKADGEDLRWDAWTMLIMFLIAMEAMAS